MYLGYRVTGGTEMKGKRRGALALLLLLGLLMWGAGALNAFDRAPLLSLGALIGGGVLTVFAGFLLLASRPSGRIDHVRENVIWFCASFGIGLASLGFAISPFTHWLLPALVFAGGGVALMAWATQALGRTRPKGS
jgi:hypothetical protein